MSWFWFLTSNDAEFFNPKIYLFDITKIKLRSSESALHNVWSSRISHENRNNDDEGQCIWYGTCNKCVKGHADYNIAYDGPAKTPTIDDVTVLEAVCPELFENLGDIFHIIFLFKIFRN